MDFQTAVLAVVVDSLHRCCFPGPEDVPQDAPQGADGRRAFETAAVYSCAPGPRQAWQCAVTSALVWTCLSQAYQVLHQPVDVESSVQPGFASPTATSVVPVAQFVVWHVAQRLDAASGSCR